MEITLLNKNDLPQPPDILSDSHGDCQSIIEEINGHIVNLQVQIDLASKSIDQANKLESESNTVIGALAQLENTIREQSKIDDSEECSGPVKNTLDDVERIQKQIQSSDRNFESQLGQVFDLYSSLVLAGRALDTCEQQSKNKDNCKGESTLKLNLGEGTFDIAQDDCTELRLAHSRAWWNVHRLEIVLRAFTHVKNALQASDNALAARSSEITGIAMNPPADMDAETASELAAEARSIGTARAVLASLIATYTADIARVTTELASARAALEEARRLLDECEGDQSF